jgi:amino acid transporter
MYLVMEKEGNQPKEMNLFARKSSGLVREISAIHAIVFNLVSAGILFSFLYITWALPLYPGANLPLTAIIAIFLGLPLALVYYMLSISMPRSGGDYVWLSRITSPLVGFTLNVSIVFVLLAWIGTNPSLTIQYGVVPLLYGWSVILHNPSLMGLANSINNPLFITIFGLFYFILIGFILTRKSKTIMNILIILFIITLIGYGAYIFGLLYVGQTGFILNFNKYSGMNYNQIINSAINAGYPSTLLLTTTMFALVYTFLNLIGYVFSAYIGGEIKNVQKSQLIGMVGALVIFSILLFIIYEVTYYVMGAVFVGSISYLASSGNSLYTLPIPPFMNVLLIYGTHNLIVVTLANIGFILTPLMVIINYMLISSRNMFAWSFDRILPSFITKVDPKYSSPYVSVIIIVGLAMIFQLLWLITPAFQYFLYLTTIVFILYTVVGIAAILFPYRKKEIFESSPNIVKIKIGSLPLIVIIGILTTIISVFIVISTFLPTFGGIMNPISLVYNLSVYPIAIIIYLIAHWYRKKKGLPLEYSFKEIPPL